MVHCNAQKKMDGQKKPEGAEGQKKAMPPQVEKLLATAKEMEAILTSKLTKIDAVSLEKSEVAKQEAMKIKADVEEIKRLSLIQTKEGEDALKAKIMEVNQRIETTTRKAAELQNQLVELHKQMYDELQVKSAEVKNKIESIPGLTEQESSRMSEAVDTMVSHAEDRYGDSLAFEKKLSAIVQKVRDVKMDKIMSKEEVMKKLDEQLDLILRPSKSPSEEKVDDSKAFKADPRKNKE